MIMTSSRIPVSTASLTIKSFDLNGADTCKLGFPDGNPADGYLITLIEDGHTTRILLDAGKKGQGEHIILPYLLQQGILRIDYLILSHPHYDHFGGMIDLLRETRIQVGQFIHASPPNAFIAREWSQPINMPLWEEFQALIAARKIDERRIAKADVGIAIAIGNALSLSIIAIPDELQYEDADFIVNLNDCSLVLKLVFKSFTALFPGDCGQRQADAIARSEQIGLLADVFLLKASHHGGDESMSPQLNDLCNPRLVLIPCNETVVYHRPIFITNMHAFSLSGAKVLRQDFCRDIVIETDGTSVSCTSATDQYSETIHFNDIGIH